MALSKRDYEEAFSAVNLYDVFVALDPGTAYGVDRQTKDGFGLRAHTELRRAGAKAVAGTYKFTRYRQVLLPKGATKLPRVVSIPTIRDKVVLKVLQQLLTQAFPQASPAKVKTLIRNLVSGLNSGRFDAVIRLDIETFYPSLDHGILMRAVKTRIRRASTLHLILNAISTPTSPIEAATSEPKVRGVPQGLSISNVLANVYMLNLDRRMSLPPNVLYLRFVDDICILCRSHEKDRILRLITLLVSERGLTLNADKTYVGDTSGEFDFLGYHWYGSKLGVRVSSTRNLEDSIARLFSRYAHKRMTLNEFLFRLNARITGCMWDSRKYGWMFFFSQTEDMSQLFHLDWYVSQLLHRYHLSLNVKSFVRAYFEISRNLDCTKYIPKLNMTFEAKHRLLRDLWGADVDKYTNLEVEQRFARLARGLVRDLERDLQRIS